MELILKTYKSKELYTQLSQVENGAYRVFKGIIASNGIIGSDNFNHYYATKQNALKAFNRLIRKEKEENE